MIVTSSAQGLNYIYTVYFGHFMVGIILCFIISLLLVSQPLFAIEIHCKTFRIKQKNIIHQSYSFGYIKIN